MINKKLAFIAIPVLAAVLIGGSLSPAFAAQKLVDNRSITDDGPFGPFNICLDDNVFLTVHTTSFFVLWDNDKFKSHINQAIEWVDADDGSLVAEQSFVFNGQGDFVDLPLVQQANFSNECTKIPGTLFEFSSGFTIHKDGSVTSHS